ncbi:predicted protein [Histoplasma capsulatum H143]|uniref:Uncharacterized protein n=1 Tax=Ajellomyces capsulatus (strain H143) TaxID=544712 RepID=C6H2X0_AJECH|nr:predicted protein [Histoplasma capsulatum H143]
MVMKMEIQNTDHGKLAVFDNQKYFGHPTTILSEGKHWIINPGGVDRRGASTSTLLESDSNVERRTVFDNISDEVSLKPVTEKRPPGWPIFLKEFCRIPQSEHFVKRLLHEDLSIQSCFDNTSAKHRTYCRVNNQLAGKIGVCWSPWRQNPLNLAIEGLRGKDTWGWSQLWSIGDVIRKVTLEKDHRNENTIQMVNEEDFG